MPRPDTLVPVWSRRGEARVSHLAFSAAALITATSRGSLMWRSRNSIGSALTAADTSSMKDSLAKWICGPTGSRKCELRRGEAASSNGGKVSPEERFVGDGIGVRRHAKTVTGFQRHAQGLPGQRVRRLAAIGVDVDPRES